MFLLSPFDNLIIQRERTKRIFYFDYTLECYVPAPKRKHGYFVLPVLWGDKFVGRMDPKADRDKKTLIIKKLVFEDNFKEYDQFLASFYDPTHFQSLSFHRNERSVQRHPRHRDPIRKSGRPKP